MRRTSGAVRDPEETELSGTKAIPGGETLPRGHANNGQGPGYQSGGMGPAARVPRAPTAAPAAPPAPRPRPSILRAPLPSGKSADARRSCHLSARGLGQLGELTRRFKGKQRRRRAVSPHTLPVLCTRSPEADALLQGRGSCWRSSFQRLGGPVPPPARSADSALAGPGGLSTWPRQPDHPSMGGSLGDVYFQRNPFRYAVSLLHGLSRCVHFGQNRF